MVDGTYGWFVGGGVVVRGSRGGAVRWKFMGCVVGGFGGLRSGITIVRRHAEPASRNNRREVIKTRLG